MRVVIAYASWFGHNRAIAKALAQELMRQGTTVVCAPASRIKADELSGVDLLVLGTYTHGGRASRRLRRLCATIPPQRIGRMDVAVFGTQSAALLDADQPGGVDDLLTYLAARGIDVAVPPLRIGLAGWAAVRPGQGIGPEEYREIRAFARDLLEASVAAPL